MSDGKLEFDTELNTHGMNTELEKMGAKAEKATGKFSGLKTAAGKLGDNLKKVAKFAGEALIGISTGILGAGAASANVGMGFESAMSKVGAISNASADDMDKLSEKAKEMGATTKFSASESAEAFQYMAMAGWKADKMLGGIEGIMNLAAADGLDLATTSDIVTDAITAFGLSADDSAHFADVLATASSSANTNVSMLGESFKYVAPLAGSMHYSVEDVSLALGLMANASVKGSMAGTSLKTALANLNSPTKAMKTQMDKLGISMTDSNGNSLSLRDTIIQLREKFKGLSESEKTAAASTLFGKEAMSGMLAIINAGDKDFESLVKNIDSADGAAKRMADTLNDNLAGDITIAKSALEGFGIAVYDTIKDKLRSAVQLGTDYIGRLSNAFKNGGLKGAVEEAGEIFGDLTIRIAEHAPEMVDAAIEFIKSFAKAIWDNRDTIIQSVKKIIGNIKDKLLELLPPSIREPIRNAVGGVEKALNGVVGMFKNVFTSKGIADAISFVVELIGGIVSTITNVIEKVLPAFQKGFEKIRDALASEGFKRAISTATEIIKALGDIIGNVASVVIPIICDALSNLMQNLDWLIPLIGTAAGAWGAWKLVNKAAEWCDGFIDKLKKVGDKLSNLGDTLADTTTKNSGMVSGMLAIPGAQIAAIIGTIIAAVAVLATYLVVNNEEATRIKELAEDVKTSGDAANESAQKVADGFANIGAKAQEFIDGVNNAKSSLEGLDGVIDKDRESKLTERMEGLQKDFNKIAGDYSEERKKLTEEELKSLEDLFAKMRSVADQEVELQMSWQGVTVTQAEMLARDFAGADDYTEKSQEILKGAAESKEKAIEAASKAYNTELLNLNKMYSGEELQAKTKEAYAHYTDNLDAISKNYDKVVDVINSGNKKVNQARDNFLADESALYNSLRELRESYERSLKVAGDNQDERLLAQGVYNRATQKLWDDFNKNFSAAQQEELGIWLGSVKNAQDNGAQIDEYTAAAVDQFIRTMRMMPPETQAAMSDVVNIAESILDSAPQKVKDKAALMTQEWRDGFAAMPGDSRRLAEQTEQEIMKVLGKIPEGGEERAKELARKYAEGINNPYDMSRIRSAATEIINTVKVELGQSGDVGKTDGKALSGKYAEGVADSGNSSAIKKSASGITDTARKELTQSGEIGRSTGKMLAQGYKEGIQSEMEAIIGAADTMAKAAMIAIKKSQKSNSPSKIARELGSDLSEGYYLGISDNTRKVSSRAADIAGAAIDTIKAMGQRIGSMTESARMETGFAAQLKAAALAQAYGVSALLPSGSVRVSAGQSDGGKLVASGNIQTHIDIDGREFAVVTAPYMTEELAFYKG